MTDETEKMIAEIESELFCNFQACLCGEKRIPHDPRARIIWLITELRKARKLISDCNKEGTE